MYNQRETNPHFFELENPPLIEPRPRRQHGTTPHFPTEPQAQAPTRRERASPYPIPAESQPEVPPRQERMSPYQVPSESPPRRGLRPNHKFPQESQPQPQPPIRRERRPSHQFPPESQPQSPPRRERRSRYHFPTEPQPQAPPQQYDQSPTHHSGATPMIAPHKTPSHTDQKPQKPSSLHTNPHFATDNSDGLPYHRETSALRVPSRSKTTPCAWLVAAFCALFWIIVIVGGLIVLIVYLSYRPRNPKFDLTGASLNAAYLDMGYLLNGDLTLLANFTNANKKMKVDFSYIVMDLYFSGVFIATTYVEPLSVMSRQSRFANAHFTPSQVKLSLELSQELQRQMDNGRVKLEIKVLIKTKSKLVGIFKYSYWLYSTCNILVVSPPNGALLGHRCVTKR
ncbi:hypothetical protein LIER_10887 [Lithospermum erythrorhizon]|uniref:Late embryogenesis abundant protein LEA-2 subgroup domain-containing protein n=1 Tax=Lithospermum erythrorhizon TaxID=34254 RepID=A0AAV3PLC3_LITER